MNYPVCCSKQQALECLRIDVLLLNIWIASLASALGWCPHFVADDAASREPQDLASRQVVVARFDLGIGGYAGGGPREEDEGGESWLSCYSCWWFGEGGWGV